MIELMEIIRILFLIMLGSQGAYFMVTFFLYSWAMEWYEWGTFRNAENLFTKTVNAFTMSVFGIAYWAGTKVKDKNAVMKRVYILGYAILYFIFAIMTYIFVDYLLIMLENSIYS